MAKISVSLLDADWTNLEKTVKDVVAGGFDSFHMDVMDGTFVSNISFGHKFCETVRKLAPKPIHVEAHLMVNDPALQMVKFSNIGLDGLLVHFEPMYYREIRKTLIDIKNNKMEPGLVIKPKTNVTLIYEYLNDVKVLMLMSVEPGMGGQSFIVETLDKIKKLVAYRTTKKLNFEILVDGGINPETCKLCKEAGADRFVVGSYIFKNGIKESFQKFSKI